VDVDCSWRCDGVGQDLAKVKLAARTGTGSSRVSGAVTAGPVPLLRQLEDPARCPLVDWAPAGGPVRPLLQVRRGGAPAALQSRPSVKPEAAVLHRHARHICYELLAQSIVQVCDDGFPARSTF
jgi:hypothetical protein